MTAYPSAGQTSEHFVKSRIWEFRHDGPDRVGLESGSDGAQRKIDEVALTKSFRESTCALRDASKLVMLGNHKRYVVEQVRLPCFLEIVGSSIDRRTEIVKGPPGPDTDVVKAPGQN